MAIQTRKEEQLTSILKVCATKLAMYGRAITEPGFLFVYPNSENKDKIMPFRATDLPEDASERTEWARKFERTGSANNVKRKGPKKSVRTPENIDRVRSSVEHSPKRSTRKKAEAVRICIPNRLHFAETLHENEIDIHNLWMSDEAHFHLSDYTNKQNCRYWSLENPLVLHVQPLHSLKVMMKMGMLLRYTDMINQFLSQHLNRLPRNNQTWFQQDSAISHTTRASLNSLQSLFPRHIISRRGDIEWLPMSSDFTVWDYCFWGYLKQKLSEDEDSYHEQIGSIEDNIEIENDQNCNEVENNNNVDIEGEVEEEICEKRKNLRLMELKELSLGIPLKPDKIKSNSNLLTSHFSSDWNKGVFLLYSTTLFERQTSFCDTVEALKRAENQEDIEEQAEK
ncbi:hypothetical protein ILUMI_08715 [Ignelater luminosus]|uniref:Uncharacterized protein n=1 Tax=Ignelater luminosus TaxID=2038154 RepID=A0A8K0DAR4_IGNLU|nr:hypothetical protein ILUMI_08715 [Ignelater luminosus]